MAVCYNELLCSPDMMSNQRHRNERELKQNKYGYTDTGDSNESSEYRVL